jgi:hypothetical protein
VETGDSVSGEGRGGSCVWGGEMLREMPVYRYRSHGTYIYLLHLACRMHPLLSRAEMGLFLCVILCFCV